MKKLIVVFLSLIIITGCGKTDKEKIKETKLDSCKDYTLGELFDNYFIEGVWNNDGSIEGVVFYNNKINNLKINFEVDDNVSFTLSDKMINKDNFINEMCKAKKNRDNGIRDRIEVPVRAIYDANRFSVNLPKTVTVEIYGNKDIINSYKQNNSIYALLDLTNIRGKQIVYYQIGFTNETEKSNLVYYVVNPYFQEVDVVETSRNIVDVELVIDDEIKSHILEMDYNKKIEIYGPKEKVEKVEKIKITINKSSVGDYQNGIKNINDIKAVDMFGNEIDNITFDASKIITKFIMI